MRVLMLSWEYPPVIEGGLGRHVLNLCEQLAADGVEVHVLTRATGEGAHDYVAGVNVHRISAPATPTNIDEFISWVTAMNASMLSVGLQLAQHVAFDVVHSHDWLVADAARSLAHSLGRPWLTTVHATEYGRHQGWVENYPQSYIHGLEQQMVHNADHVIACSEYMADHIAEVFTVPREKITPIPNGIDPSEITPPDNTDLPLARDRYAQPDELIVFMVGRLVYEKGFHLALDALSAVIQENPGVRFVVAGTGSAEADLHDQAEMLQIAGHGRFLGWIGDQTLHTLYRVSDVCVVPSIYEPFGIVALEAMAAGCVCVVADTGGLQEIVPDDESAGIRFTAGDAEALGEVLTGVLSDASLRERLAVEGRRYVKRFDWVSVTQATEDVYTALTGICVPSPLGTICATSAAS